MYWFLSVVHLFCVARSMISVPYIEVAAPTKKKYPKIVHRKAGCIVMSRTRKVTVLLYHEFLYIFECATSLRRIHDLSMMLLLYYIFYFHQLKNCLMQLV